MTRPEIVIRPTDVPTELPLKAKHVPTLIVVSRRQHIGVVQLKLRSARLCQVDSSTRPGRFFSSYVEATLHRDTQWARRSRDLPPRVSSCQNLTVPPEFCGLMDFGKLFPMDDGQFVVKLSEF